MVKTVTATYENGLLRPAEPLPLEEGQRVELTVSTPDDDDARRHEALIAGLNEIAALPLESPNDGFSGADHDKVLYGGERGAR